MFTSDQIRPLILIGPLGRFMIELFANDKKRKPYPTHFMFNYNTENYWIVCLLNTYTTTRLFASPHQIDNKFYQIKNLSGAILFSDRPQTSVLDLMILPLSSYNSDTAQTFKNFIKVSHCCSHMNE